MFLFFEMLSSLEISVAPVLLRYSYKKGALNAFQGRFSFWVQISDSASKVAQVPPPYRTTLNGRLKKLCWGFTLHSAQSNTVLSQYSLIYPSKLDPLAGRLLHWHRNCFWRLLLEFLCKDSRPAKRDISGGVWALSCKACVSSWHIVKVQIL